MFGFGDGKYVDAVTAGNAQFLGLLEINGIGIPPRFWIDPYVLGFLFGTGTMLAAVVSKNSLHGDRAGGVLMKSLRRLAGIREDQAAAAIRRCMTDNDVTFFEAVEKGADIVEFVHAGLKSRPSLEITVARGLALSSVHDLNSKSVTEATYYHYMRTHWIDVIRKRFGLNEG